MIYLSDCSRYTNIVRRGFAIDFIELTTSSSSSSEPLKSYIDQRQLRRCDLKVFLVETEAMAWYMGVFAATPEQCSDAYQQKHLCVVACQHGSGCQHGSIRKLHAASSILFLPQIHPHKYSHLTHLDCLLRKHPVLAKAVAKLNGIALRRGHAPPECLTVQLAPCLRFACTAPLESGEEIGAATKACSMGAADDDELCIVCTAEIRKWRWSRCTHVTDGPSLICGHCKKALLQAERLSRGVVSDNRCFVVTKCIICNQPSEFVKCNQRRAFIRR